VPNFSREKIGANRKIVPLRTAGNVEKVSGLTFLASIGGNPDKLSGKVSGFCDFLNLSGISTKNSYFLAGLCILMVEVSKMSAKKTMTLNLTDQEMDVLEELAQKKDISKTAIIRQALRLYQLIDFRISEGEKLYFEDSEKKEKSELMLI
jgi:hypothetical protein